MSQSVSYGPETSDRNEAQQNALNELTGCLRVLAAEIMRMAADGGDYTRVGGAVYAAANAYDAYKDAFGFWPSSGVVRTALDPDSAFEQNRPWISAVNYPRRELELDAAKKKIKKGALRAVAAVYVDQLTHERRGDSLMIDGVRDWNAA